MNKIFLITVVIMFAIAVLCGCGSTNNSDKENSQTNQSTTQSDITDIKESDFKTDTKSESVTNDSNAESNNPKDSTISQNNKDNNNSIDKDNQISKKKNIESETPTPTDEVFEAEIDFSVLE